MIYKTCDLCKRKFPTNMFFVKIQEHLQWDGVSDVCEECYYTLDELYNKLKPLDFIFAFKHIIQLSDRIHGT